MKVSVAMITYNHEAFVAEAIESVLAQKADFALELVVCEDRSIDGTAAIVAEYQRRHPDIVRAVFNTENLGAHRNWVQSMDLCRGEYIAFLDGDDFWSCPDKLRRQVEQMDENPDLSMAFHPVHVLYADGTTGLYVPPGRLPRYELVDLVPRCFIATASAMCRRDLGVRFPDWYDEVAGMPGDWVLYSRYAHRGPIGYLDEPMAAYRQHEGSLSGWRGSSKTKPRALNAVARHLDAETGRQHTWAIRFISLRRRMKIFVARRLPIAVDPLTRARNAVHSRRRATT